MLRRAREKNLAHCTFHNLRYYPQIQQMRRLREAGELGEILVAQGTYSQDWLLYDTDWNWRIESGLRAHSPISELTGATWSSTSPASVSDRSVPIFRLFSKRAKSRMGQWKRSRRRRLQPTD